MKPELTKSGILKIKPHMLNSHLESLPPAAIFLNSNVEVDPLTKLIIFHSSPFGIYSSSNLNCQW